jgi:hypothetical protein
MGQLPSNSSDIVVFTSCYQPPANACSFSRVLHSSGTTHYNMKAKFLLTPFKLGTLDGLLLLICVARCVVNNELERKWKEVIRNHKVLGQDSQSLGPWLLDVTVSLS